MPAVGTTHHIKLDGNFYLVKPGSYRKSSAPMYGARFSTGDPDFNNLSFWQHWAQKCWIGGMDAVTWEDDSMYDQGVGVNTMFHDKVTQGRQLAPGGGANWTIGQGANVKSWKFFVYNDILYVMTLPSVVSTVSAIYKYVPASDGWSLVTTFVSTHVKSVTTFAGKVFIGGNDSGTSAIKVLYSSGGLTSWTTVANPAGVVNSPRVMRAFQQKLYVAFGRVIWRLKEDLTWDGNTAFYNASAASESNHIIAMEPHLGFLYMLSQNGHVHRTDGNATFDLWNWDGGTTGIALKSFDGRLFVAVNEYSDPANQGAAYGVLYQMSGSAMTQLKRWGKENEYTGLGSLTVYDRRLFYGASNLFGMRAGFGVATYDPVEDAHSIFASNAATGTYTRGAAPYTNYGVGDVIFFGSRMYMTLAGYGCLATPYSVRDQETGLARFDITSIGASLDPQNGGWLTTSTYDAGTPGLIKLWRQISVDYELPSSACGIVIEYSINGGSTWVNASELSTGSSVARTRAVIPLSNVKSTSLKLRITLRTTSSSVTPTFYGFVVSYIGIPEPNWQWTFTIPNARVWTLVDGTQETRDTEACFDALSTAFRTKAMLNFIDAEGDEWTAGGGLGVIIDSIDFYIYDQVQPLEGDIRITLIEAVESY